MVGSSGASLTPRGPSGKWGGSRKWLSPTLRPMPKKLVGHFRIPPNYSQMPDAERLAHAKVIAERLREAITAQEPRSTSAKASSAYADRTGVGIK
jgi:hypothetical protein